MFLVTDSTTFVPFDGKAQIGKAPKQATAPIDIPEQMPF